MPGCLADFKRTQRNALQPMFLDRLNPRTGGTPANLLQKFFEAFPLGLEFHALVFQVAHPTHDTQALSPVTDVPAETNSLDVTANKGVHRFHSMMTVSL